MTGEQLALLEALELGELEPEELRERFPGALLDDPSFVEAEVHAALASGDEDRVETVLQLVFLCRGEDLLALKHHLLLTPGHRQHQAVARELQRLAHPSTVPVVQELLRRGYDHLDYTASEPEVITKWLSWILAAIGTEEALVTLEAHADAGQPGVSEEMAYRLRRLGRR